jgi:hypothetical protein
MRYALALLFVVAAVPASFGCTFVICSDEVPRSPMDHPRCSDYEMNERLIDALNNGDRSAATLLLDRYAQAITFTERTLIGTALLGKVPDDSKIWMELSARAADALQFTPAPAGWDPDEYRWSLNTTFQAIGHDPRSRQLMLKALDSSDDWLSTTALIALLRQRDEKSLPQIAAALQRTDRISLAFELANFRSAAADAVAKKVLSEEDGREYDAMAAWKRANQEE